MVAQVDLSYFRSHPKRIWPRICAYLFFEGRPLTTRGRFINPLVFLFFNVLMKLPGARRVNSPAFIVGMGRSGTTALGVALSTQKKISFLNEAKAVWAFAISEEDLIGSYNLQPARYRFAAGDVTDSASAKLRAVYSAFLKLTSGSVLLEKYPELLFRLDYILEIFPDAKFLFLSRNGEDVCASVQSWSALHGESSARYRADWWGINGRKWRYVVDQLVVEHEDLAPYRDELESLEDQAAMAAVEWIISMREGLKVVAAGHESVLHIAYEVLCETPEVCLDQISSFLGWTPSQTEAASFCERFEVNKKNTPIMLPEWLREPFESTQAMLDAATKPAREG